ncbi:unnamed protein product [Cylicocyclus nassatus]|uniref:Saposin B-type domain-containing protein n=1 Tax=Cylicocyclus nassatus TaxID=53992 RepID=A0AA36DU69_CYLNA|nr:unnamed protein product [Cylicocyclus nassatus]
MKTVLIAIFCVALSSAEKRKKPLCEMCEEVVKTMDKLLKKGEDLEKAMKKYCDTDCPDYLKQYCLKIDKKLKYLIQKLEDHGTPEEICTSMHLCAV